MNIVFPPRPPSSLGFRPTKSRTLSSFSFSSPARSNNGLRRSPPRPPGPHQRLHSPLLNARDLEEHQAEERATEMNSARPAGEEREDIELMPIVSPSPRSATFLFPPSQSQPQSPGQSQSPSPSFHSFPPTPHITITPEVSRSQSRSHPYRSSMSHSRRSGPFLAHQPKNPRRSRLTYAILILLSFLAASVGSAVVESAMVGYLLAGLYSAGHFEMSTCVGLFLCSFVAFL